MRSSSRLVLPVLGLLLAACGPDESTDLPPETAIETPAEAAVTPPEVAGTYRLRGTGEVGLPTRVGQVDECAVELTEGTLTLGPDARYRLDVLARAVCEEDDPAPPIDRAVREGSYTVAGADVRFGPETTRAAQGAEPETESPEENLFDMERFSGNGTIRDSVLTVTLDDLTALVFVRE